MKVLLTAFLLLFLLMPAKVAESSASQYTVRVTFYLPTGNPMYSGYYPYVGAAACSWNFPIGTILEMSDGWQVQCLDRGLLGSTGWVDIYMPTYAAGLRSVESIYGLYDTIAVVRWGYAILEEIEEFE